MIDDPFKMALTCRLQEEGEDESIFLSQDVPMALEKVRSVEKIPPEPHSHVNFKGVHYFCGTEFYHFF